MTNAEDIHAVSTVVVREGRFLLVRRGRAPSKGLFAFPGGRVEAGENDEAAARRELLEETGLSAGEMTLHAQMTIDGDGKPYRLKVFHAVEAEGVASARDDADYLGWYMVEEMRGLPVTSSTLAVAEAIASAGA